MGRSQFLPPEIQEVGDPTSYAAETSNEIVTLELTENTAIIEIDASNGYLTISYAEGIATKIDFRLLAQSTTKDIFKGQSTISAAFTIFELQPEDITPMTMLQESLIKIEDPDLVAFCVFKEQYISQIRAIITEGLQSTTFTDTDPFFKPSLDYIAAAIFVKYSKEFKGEGLVDEKVLRRMINERLINRVINVYKDGIEENATIYGSVNLLSNRVRIYDDEVSSVNDLGWGDEFEGQEHELDIEGTLELYGEFRLSVVKNEPQGTEVVVLTYSNKTSTYALPLQLDITALQGSEGLQRELNRILDIVRSDYLC